jgi:hypothetical protein
VKPPTVLTATLIDASFTCFVVAPISMANAERILSRLMEETPSKVAI